MTATGKNSACEVSEQKRVSDLTVTLTLIVKPKFEMLQRSWVTSLQTLKL